MNVQKKARKRISIVLVAALVFQMVLINFAFKPYVYADEVPMVTLNVNNKIDVALAASNSAQDISTFEADLKAALLSKGGVPASNVYVSAVEASEVSVESNFNWWIYDHYNTNPGATGIAYPTPYINETTHQYVEGYNETSGNFNLLRHIIVEDGGTTMTMNGYGSPAYKDFMYMENSSATKKTFEFKVQEISAYDALNGGGFLFNTRITGTYGSNQLMSGYLLFLEYNYSGKGQGIRLYKFENIDTRAFHQSTSNMISNYPGFTLLASSSNYLSTDTWRKVKIEAYPNKLKMWYKGSTSEYNDVLTDSQLITWSLNVGGTSSEVSLPAYTGTKSYGFGPMISYGSHNCSRLTQFKFKDLSMGTDVVKSLTEVIRQPEWHEGTQKFIVNLNESVIDDFNDEQKISEIISRMNNDDIYYVGWGTDINETQSNQFLEKHNLKGTFVNINNDVTNTYQEQIDAIAVHILTRYNKNIGTGDAYILTTDNVIFSSANASLTNTADIDWPQGKWRVDHDITGFDNSKGLYAYDNILISDLDLTFEKPGKYDIYYENSKIKTIYAHEKPIGLFDISYNSGTGSITYSDNSYDPDQQSQSGRGIAERAWSYLDISAGGTVWTPGQLTSAEPNKSYIIALKVKDEYGEWSNEYTKQLYTGTVALKPVADFEIAPSQILKGIGAQSIAITDKSYDPSGDNITAWEWKVTRGGVPVYGPSATPKTDFSSDQVGKYKIDLRAQSQNGWSETISRFLTIIEDTSSPTVTVNPVSGNGAVLQPLQVALNFSDTGGSFLKLQRYALTNNTTTPSQGWSTDSSNLTRNITLNAIGTWYIHYVSEDNCGNTLSGYSGPYIITATAPQVTTSAPASGVTVSSASVSGEVVSDGGESVTAQGIQYKKSADTVFIAMPASLGTNSFTVDLTGLAKGTAYHFKAYATNSVGTSYGSVQSFTTLPNEAPTGSIEINNGSAYTNNSTVNISLTVTDNDPLDTADTMQMSFSSDNLAWTPWDSYSSQKAYQLEESEGIKTIYVKLRDAYEDESPAYSDSIILDKTEPISIGIINSNLYNGIYYHNSDVTPSFNFDISGKGAIESIYLVNGEFKPYSWSEGQAITTEGTYSFVATDNAGNTAAHLFVIDKTKPSVAPFINIVSEDTGANVGMRMLITKPSSEAVDPSNNYIYTIDGSIPAFGNPSNQIYTLGGVLFSIEGTYTVRASYVDAAGNFSSSRTLTFVVDKTNPVIDASDTYYDWRAKDADVILTIDDALSGISSQEYVWSNSGDSEPILGWQEYNETVTKAEEGIWYLWYQITDVAGNLIKGNFGPYKIDKTAPQKPSIAASNGYINGTWTNKDVTLNVTSQDVLSGVQKYQYSFSSDNNNWSQWTDLEENIMSVSTKTAIEQFVRLRAVDNADVNSPESDVWHIRIDKQSPLIEGIDNGEYSKSDEIAITLSDADSGLASSGTEAGYNRYKLNNGDWQPLNGSTVSFLDEGSYEMEVYDNAGNKSALEFTIDRTAPTVTGVANDEFYSIDVTPVISDVNLSTVVIKRDNTAYAWDGSSTITQEGSYSIGASDLAGNVTTVIFTIDKTDPIISGVLDGAYYNASVTPSVYDMTLDTITLTKNDEAIAFTDGQSIIDDGIYKLRVEDKVGKIVEYSFVVDTQKPIITGVVDEEHYNAAVQPVIDFGLSSKKILTLNGDDWASSTVISVDGEYTLYAEDNSGNSETVNFAIDTVKPNEPTIEVVQEEGRTNVYIRITPPSGENSGKLVYTLNGSIPKADSIVYEDIFELSEDGMYTVKAAYIDQAGNIGKVATLIVTVDITPPEYEGVEHNKYYNIPVTPIFTGHYSLVAEKMNDETGQWEPYAWTNNTQISDEGTYKITTEDVYSNGDIVIFTIDTTPPTATISYDITELTNTDVSAVLSEPSEEVTITNNGGEYTYVFTENGTFTFEFKDAAGNAGSATATVNNIEKTAPVGTVEIENDSTYTTSQLVTLTITASDDSGNEGLEMRFSSDGESWSAWEAVADSKDYSLSNGYGIKYVYLQLKDKLGNISTTTDTIIYKSIPSAGEHEIFGYEDEIIEFAATDFEDLDEDEYELSLIKITSLPSNGTLLLQGTRLIDQVVLPLMIIEEEVIEEEVIEEEIIEEEVIEEEIVEEEIVEEEIIEEEITEDEVEQYEVRHQQLNVEVKTQYEYYTLDVTVGQEISVEELNNLTFVPDDDWNGITEFTWTASDGIDFAKRDSKMTIYIQPVNDSPIADDGSLTTDAGVEANGILTAEDIDRDSLTYIIVSTSGKGTLTLIDASTGEYLYVPHDGSHGSDSFEFKVNDGTEDSNIAQINVTIIPSDEAKLNALLLNQGTLSPSFDPNTINYSMSVKNSISSIVIKPTAADSNAVVKINGTIYSNGAEGLPIALKVGQNKIQIEVTAQDGITKTTYTATVNRESASSREESSNTGSTPQPNTNTNEVLKPSGIDVFVNGKAENAGALTTSEIDGQTVTIITVDSEKLRQRLEKEGDNAVVTIPVNAETDVIVGELNGQIVKDMENKQAVVEVRTETITYTLPAQQIDIDAISAKLGQNVKLSDIKVSIVIAKASEQTVKIIEDIALKGSFTIVVPPVDFTVKCTYAGKTLEISRFNVYVERTIAIPEGVDPTKITTGVVVDPDGTVRHVPTQIIIIDGKYYAKINSMTNSDYLVIWNPTEFKDAANHWAKEAINDMGSRMVINGDGNGSFAPDRDITRAEFAATIVRALGLKPGMGTNIFTDVKASDWYSDYVKTAYEYKIISGYGNGKFGPMDKITREQAMTMICSAMKLTGLKAEFIAGEIENLLAEFTDSEQSAIWAKESMAASVKTGIVSGKGRKMLAPKDNITRAEVAVIVRLLLQKSNLI